MRALQKQILWLVLATLISANAQASIWRRFTREWELSFSSEPEEVLPRGYVLPVRDSTTKQVLGSATRICLDRASYEATLIAGAEQAPDRWNRDFVNVDQTRQYWVTAAHVVNDRRDLLLDDGSKVQVIMRDELMDLALMAGPWVQGACVPLADTLQMGTVYDIEAGFFVDQKEIEIEAPEVTHWLPQGFRMKSILSTFRGSGIPGRDQAGPVIAMIARGFRGQSGGAVLGQVDTGGRLNDELYGIELKDYAYPKLVGMIVAVDSSGRRMAALPAPTIYQRIKRYFMNPPHPLSTLLVKSVPAGSLYTAFDGTHYRGWLPSCGIGDMADGGIGDLADGGNPGPGGVYYPASGLQLKERRWLSFSQKWAELEPLSQEVYLRLSQKESLEGLYIQDGKILASSNSVPIPDWLVIPENQRDLYSLDEAGSWKLRNSGPNAPLCTATLGMERRKTKTYGTMVMICERNSGSAKELWLSTIGGRDQTPRMDFHVVLKRKPCASDGACPVEVAGERFPDAPDGSTADRLVEEYWKRVSKLGRGKRRGEALRVEGLRLLRAKGIGVMIGRNGGYRIQLGKGEDKIEISGPASVLPDTLLPRPELIPND